MPKREPERCGFVKTIGVIGAMDEEIAQLKPRMDVVQTKSIAGADYYIGKMYANSVVLVRCGIGKVNAAICAQILIDLYAIDYCVNIGAAGAINKDLSIGDVVVSRDAVHHDFSAVAFGDPPGFIPRTGVLSFPADERLARLAETCGRAVLTENKLAVGRIASGDSFICDADEKARIWHTFKADCVEMEGAAVAQVCWLNKIPFVIIRSISDIADSSASVNFSETLTRVSAVSSEIVENMVKSL
jgi:adenosylhomocysteine nucleosidase